MTDPAPPAWSEQTTGLPAESDGRTTVVQVGRRKFLAYLASAPAFVLVTQLLDGAGRASRRPG